MKNIVRIIRICSLLAIPSQLIWYRLPVLQGIQKTSTVPIHTISAKKAIRILSPAQIDIKNLYNRFEGRVVINNTSVHVDYKHLFSIGKIQKVLCTGKCSHPSLYGSHHDYMKQREQAGIVRYKHIVEGPCGAFKAQVMVHGILYPSKTFFPPRWTEEKVVSTILDLFARTYKPERYAIGKTGCCTVQGKTADGLVIRMIFDPKKSLITTAFPIIE
ncbi:MAG TPA: EndoU domain-containing protein [Candidatus Babeliales bacterium]|nr:EndoU domain-containing protein [Candidatus Babeliales bacterium]